jgi:hypothetical protein
LRSLVAVQNGLRVPRVIHCAVNKKQDGIESVHILESNHPDYAWPTLGVMVKNSFRYVANSQWVNFSTNGKVVDAAKSTPTYILKLDLH